MHIAIFFPKKQVYKPNTYAMLNISDNFCVMWGAG